MDYSSSIQQGYSQDARDAADDPQIKIDHADTLDELSSDIMIESDRV